MSMEGHVTPRAGGGRKSWPSGDEEASIPDTIEIARSYSSSLGSADDTDEVLVGLEEAVAATMKQKADDQGSEHLYQEEPSRRGLKAFTLEMMCCLTLLVGMGVGVRFMWGLVADPSLAPS